MSVDKYTMGRYTCIHRCMNKLDYSTKQSGWQEFTPKLLNARTITVTVWLTCTRRYRVEGVLFSKYAFWIQRQFSAHQASQRFHWNWISRIFPSGLKRWNRFLRHDAWPFALLSWRKAYSSRGARPHWNGQWSRVEGLGQCYPQGRNISLRFLPLKTILELHSRSPRSCIWHIRQRQLMAIIMYHHDALKVTIAHTKSAVLPPAFKSIRWISALICDGLHRKSCECSSRA